MKKNILRLFMLFFLNFYCLSNVGAQAIKDFYEQGDQAFSQGDYKKAIELYEKVIELDPNFAPAYNALGLAHREINTNLSEVAWLFKTATEIDPKDAHAYDNLGKVYYGMGEFDRALDSCLKALKLSPQMLSAKLSLGWIYLLGKSNPKQAIRYFKEILAENKLPYAYFGLGMAYFMDNDRVSVLEIITTLRSIQKEDLASQLEGMIRSSPLAERKTEDTIPNTPTQNFTPRPPVGVTEPPLPRSSSSSLIPSTVPVEPYPISNNPRSASLMRVRLKGKMYGLPGEDNKAESTTASSSTESALTNNVETRQRSAIERIRSLRTSAVASGRASGSVSGRVTNSQNQSTP